MSKLRVALVQMPLIWQSPAENRREIEKRLTRLPPCDLVVLPEMFTTGFSATDPKGAELPDGETVTWLQTLAIRYDVAFYGSLKVHDEPDYFNRGIVVSADGLLASYDKRHLFRIADEHLRFAPGSKRVIVNFKGFRIMLQICYDLRFPVWMRNCGDYDLALVVANWPKARRDAWITLLRARALENATYVIGVNRVGTDGQGIDYAGDSMAVDFKGDELANPGAADVVNVAELDLEALHLFRKKFPVHLDADSFSIVDS